MVKRKGVIIFLTFASALLKVTSLYKTSKTSITLLLTDGIYTGYLKKSEIGNMTIREIKEAKIILIFFQEEYFLIWRHILIQKISKAFHPLDHHEDSYICKLLVPQENSSIDLQQSAKDVDYLVLLVHNNNLTIIM